MSHSFSSLHYHIVFGTKDREPIITTDCRQRVCDYLGGIARQHEWTLYAAGGTADHVHLLLGLGRDDAPSTAVRILKTSSSRWIHEMFPDLHHFAWQEGYGAFSISFSGIERVRAYIASQEEHHRVVSFREEFLEFLERHGIPHDERFLWR